MNSGAKLSGKVLQTNDADVLLLTDYAAFNFSRAGIKHITIDTQKAFDVGNSGRLPRFKRALIALSKQPWATELTPIPSTVIDNGIFKNVPYTSFRCAKDYELNIYGNLDSPAAIEIGVYNSLLKSLSAKSNCIAFIDSLLRDGSDKEVINGLNLEKDLKTWEQLTFEITPPEAMDAYNGWWISVYSEPSLNAARASDEEMKNITVDPSSTPNKEKGSDEIGAWSASDLKLARQMPLTISFTNSSGMVVTNAQVLRVVDGIWLLWRNTDGSGSVKLVDLPEELRDRFGYDPAKEQEVARKEKERLAQVRQNQANAIQAAQAAETVRQSFVNTSSSSADVLSGEASYSSSGSGYHGGPVFVHGYSRKDGTYVHSYTRSAPHRR